MHTLTIKSKKPLLVIPLEEYESMRETIELLSANPRLPQELREIRKRMDKGESISLDDFKKKYKVR
jgi:PHD/YefM family antitoxin component YafN of YafNO toxin-antitoxin module